MGRVVFTHHTLPAIRPVNHIVEGQQIVFRTGAAAAITTAVDGTGTIVAFEADAIDPFNRMPELRSDHAPILASAASGDDLGADPKLASIPFSTQAAQDADRGQPVMITQAIPEQVAAYQLVARKIQTALSGGNGPLNLN